MRKYRGKRVDTGEWVYGYLIGNDVIVGEIVEFNDEYFNTEFWYKVDPKTVGQYTGLKDKNGVKIYEGDICRGVDFKLKVEFMSVAKWHKNGYWYAFNKEGKGIGFLNNIELLEVIGNDHDNPELLEGTV